MAGKIDKKELQEPDQLQLFFIRLRAFAQANRNRLLAGTGAFILVAAIACGWYLYRLNYEKSAAAVYNKVQDRFLKTGSPVGDGEAIREYRALIERYPGSRSAALARYSLGNLLFGRGQFDEAIAAYEDFLRRGGEGGDLVTLAYGGLGACYEGNKNYPKALESYENALKSQSSSSFEALNCQNAARVHEAMNNPAKALEFYRKALEKTTDPLMTLYLKRKISLLG
jgi:tetratricopeptide (TPR) repeat protein